MRSYENQLLLCSTYVKHSPASLKEIAAILQQTLNWDEIMAAASWYAIKPLLYRSLRDCPETERVPPAIMSQLKKSYDDITLRNMYIYATLARILPLFKQRGIKCIVLKGAMLADTVYGDIGLRPMQDIDLLFHKEDISAAVSVVAEIGYQFEGSKSQQEYLENHFHITYTHPETDIPIELHWHISHNRHPRRLQITDQSLITQWFDRARPVLLSRIEAWTLCPTDLVFHLCLHFLKHRVPRHGALFATSAALLQLSDIRRTINHYGDEIDWDELHHHAEKYHISDLIHTTIKLALEVCEQEYSGDGLLLDDDDASYRYKKLMYKRLVLHDDMNTPIPDDIINSVTINNLRGILRAFLRWLLPNKEFLAEKYSVPLSGYRMYVYYLINPFHLCKVVMQFLKQTPRLSEEMRLNNWIGGRY